MYLEDYSCVFCSLGFEEDLCHLFFHCPFAVSCWFSLNLLVPNTSDLESLLQNFRIQLQIPFLMEVIITMCWAIWSIRNDGILNGMAPSLHRCKKEFALVILRAKEKYHPFIDQWLECNFFGYKPLCNLPHFLSFLFCFLNPLVCRVLLLFMLLIYFSRDRPSIPPVSSYPVAGSWLSSGLILLGRLGIVTSPLELTC